MRKLALSVLLCALALPAAAAAQSAQSAPCVPPVPARMGACTPLPLSAPLHGEPAVHGRLGVDVSVYQGAPKWWTARAAGLKFAVDKAGEGTAYSDPTFVRNWTIQRSLGLPHAAYWFLRPVSCVEQADLLAARIRSVGGQDPKALPPVGDAEVPLPAGCVAAFVARVKADLRIRTVVAYTAPGTWPGGPNPGALLWVATYGGAPGCVWTCSHVAWQFTDSTFGPEPHGWPGIGASVDVDLDSGLIALLPNPRLDHDRALHTKLLALRRKHQCSRPTTRYRACPVWLGEIKTLDRKIAKETP